MNIEAVEAGHRYKKDERIIFILGFANEQNLLLCPDQALVILQSHHVGVKTDIVLIHRLDLNRVVTPVFVFAIFGGLRGLRGLCAGVDFVVCALLPRGRGRFGLGIGGCESGFDAVEMRKIERFGGYGNVCRINLARLNCRLNSLFVSWSKCNNQLQLNKKILRQKGPT